MMSKFWRSRRLPESEDAQEVVGPNFDAAMEDLDSAVQNLNRIKSAMVMLRYPEIEHLNRMCDHLKQLTGADAVDINVVASELQVTIATTAQIHIPLACALSDTVCVLVVGTGKTLRIEDIANNPLTRFRAVSKSWGSIASAPINVLGSPAGSVCLLHRTPRGWSEEEVHELNLTAVRIGKEIDAWVAQHLD